MTPSANSWHAQRDRARQMHIADIIERFSPGAAERYRGRVEKRVDLNEFHRKMQGFT